MDPILYWNDVALEANRVDFSSGPVKEQGGPTLSSRALAIVHLAMYDALAQALGNPAGLPAYRPNALLVPSPVSIDAAVAGAAYTTLSALYPRQQAFFNTKHTQAGLTGAGLSESHEFGRQVALLLLAARQNDGGAGDTGYVPSLARGRHRVDPDNPSQGFHAPFYAAGTTCFASKRLGLAPPPAADTTAGSDYVNALSQVRGKGIAPELMGTVPAASRRTVDETLIGIYWAYDGAIGLGTPPRLYNQILRLVAQNTINPTLGAINGVAENARLFALANAAMADAGILAWEQKYLHDFWRPVVGIREHDRSMGPLGSPGANNIDNLTHTGWLPLGAPMSNALSSAQPMGSSYPSGETAVEVIKNATPNFPAYPSGHASFGAAAFHSARLFYGLASGDRGPDTLFDDLAFVSDELNGVTQDNKGAIRPRHLRRFGDGLWDMIIENGLSRIYLGVHWSFDSFAVDTNGNPDLTQNVGGVPLGLAIAEDIHATMLSASNGAPPP